MISDRGSNMLGLVVTASMTALSPRIVKVLHNEGEEAAGKLINSMFLDNLVFVGVPFGLLCLWGELLVPLLGGGAFSWLGIWCRKDHLEVDACRAAGSVKLLGIDAPLPQGQQGRLFEPPVRRG